MKKEDSVSPKTLESMCSHRQEVILFTKTMKRFHGQYGHFCSIKLITTWKKVPYLHRIMFREQIRSFLKNMKSSNMHIYTFHASLSNIVPYNPGNHVVLDLVDFLDFPSYFARFINNTFRDN